MKLWDFELKFGTCNLKFWDLGFRNLRLEILIMKSGVWIFFFLEILKTEGFEIEFWIFETWDHERFETWNLETWDFENLQLEILSTKSEVWNLCNLKFWKLKNLKFWKLKVLKLNFEILKLEILKDFKLEILKNWNLGFWKFVT